MAREVLITVEQKIVKSMQDDMRVLVADPPWRFNDKLPGNGRGAVKHYKTLSLSEIMRFPLPELVSDAYLFLWKVAAMSEEAYQVVRAWGFVPKTEIVWCKKTSGGRAWFGMGHHVRASHETCIVATRGKPKPRSRSVRSTFEAMAGAHSEKPDEFYDLIEELCHGPYAELFARKKRDGWVQFGDELA